MDGFIDGGLINLAVVFCLLGVILWILAKESLSKLSELVTVFGAEKTVISYLVETFWQDVLEETAKEL